LSDRTAAEADDEALLCLLDGELTDSERARIHARLENDSALRDRMEALRETQSRLRLGFDALLNDAPTERMRARLDRALEAPPPSPRAKWRRRASATALAAALVAAGFVTSQLIGPVLGPPEEGWREAVAEYMEFYSADTFQVRDPAALRGDLSVVGERLGLPLDPETLRVPGLEARRAEMLQFEGAPLGQLGYLAGAIPIAFCVLRDGEPDAALVAEDRDGFATASWAKGGRGYMVIGKLPTERILEIASELMRRF
jgi:anti-sigma factor RsiW